MLVKFFRTAVPIAIGAAVFFSVTHASEIGGLNSLDSSMNQLIYQVSPSIVTIEGVDSSGRSKRCCNQSVYRTVSSGIIYNNDGNIITAAAGIAGKTNLTVTFADGTVDAGIVGIDYQTGLALLRASRPIGRPVKASTEYTCAGQMILMMGNAYGLRASPSLGFCAGARPGGTLQFQAMMTSGSMGGGLFDLSGRLVGLVVNGLSQSGQPLVGLAIPSYKLPELISYLIKHGDRQAGYIGVSATEIEITPPIQIPSIENGVQMIDRGVLVTELAPGCPGVRAGLRLGDLLYTFDGEPVTSAIDLMSAIRTLPPGMMIEFQIVRQNQIFPVKVQVADAGIYSLMPQGQSHAQTSAKNPNIDSLMVEIQKLKTSLNELEQRVSAGHR